MHEVQRGTEASRTDNRRILIEPVISLIAFIHNKSNGYLDARDSST